jgi:hypothetical protein
VAQLWDLSDLERPRTTARVHNANVRIWHSAAFTWDNQVVVFGDEAGGGGAPFCKASDPSTVGAAWFYRVADLDNLSATAQEQPLGHFKIPRPQGDVANCTMHNFNVIPVRGRYVLVSANYSGGTSVADFTDPASASEIGHFDPHGANTWSSYWYNNFIYTNDSGRDVDAAVGLRAGRGPQVPLPQPPDAGVAAGLKGSSTGKWPRRAGPPRRHPGGAPRQDAAGRAVPLRGPSGLSVRLWRVEP